MPGGIDGIGGPRPGAGAQLQSPEGPRRIVGSQDRGSRFAEALEAQRAEQAQQAGAPQQAQASQRARRGAEADGGEGFAELVRKAGRSIVRGERMVNRAIRAARSGKVFSHEELIALQAGVYRYTQELELAAKLVDKSTQAVRRTVESQR